jgi:hypothetical protein
MYHSTGLSLTEASALSNLVVEICMEALLWCLYCRVSGLPGGLGMRRHLPYQARDQLRDRTRVVITDVLRKKLLSGRPFRPDVRLSLRLTRGCGFTRERIFTISRCGKNRIRSDSIMRPCGRVNASARTWASARKPVRADISASARTRSSPCPRPPSVPPRLPCVDGLLRPRGCAKKILKKLFFL